MMSFVAPKSPLIENWTESKGLLEEEEQGGRQGGGGGGGGGGGIRINGRELSSQRSIGRES